jgi:hypothetical protein
MIASMRFRPRVISSSTVFFSIFAALALQPAHARSTEKNADTDDSEASEPEAADKKVPDSASAAEPAPPAASAGSGLLVERMPPSAFPAWRQRGITGGSLWLDGSFHGMPWPYYPKTGIGLSGSVWADNSFQRINREERFPKTDYWVHQSRAVLRVTPTYSSGDFFVQAQVEKVGNYDQNVQRKDAPDTDDLWIRFGRWNVWDVQIGRYEAFALHHFGMGLDLNTVERQGALDENSRQPVDFNYATTMFYRPNGTGNIALHLHFFEGDKGLPAIRLELLGQYGYDSFDRIGARPALIVDFGFLKIKVGTEHRWTRPRDTQVQTVLPMTDPVTGLPIGDITYVHTRKEKFYDRCLVAGTVQLVLFPWLEAGVQGAYCLSDHTTQMGGDDLDGSYTQTTMGGFANVSPLPDLVIGGGVDVADWKNLHHNDLNQFGHQTNFAAFGAIQYLIHHQLYLKLVAAYDKGKKEDLEGGTTEVTNTMMSARVRLMYLF